MRPPSTRVLGTKSRLFPQYVDFCSELWVLLTFFRSSRTKIRSVHQTAQSAGPAATHQMIRTIRTTARKPSVSQRHPVPQLHLARLPPTPIKSASLPKRHRQPRSAPATLSTVQQTINHKPRTFQSSQTFPCCLPISFEILSRSLPRIAIPLNVQIQTCSKSLRRVRRLLFSFLFTQMIWIHVSRGQRPHDIQTCTSVTSSVLFVRLLIIEPSTRRIFASLQHTMYCTFHQKIFVTLCRAGP